jgi:hypothetical protein
MTGHNQSSSLFSLTWVSRRLPNSAVFFHLPCCLCMTVMMPAFYSAWEFQSRTPHSATRDGIYFVQSLDDACVAPFLPGEATCLCWERMNILLAVHTWPSPPLAQHLLVKPCFEALTLKLTGWQLMLARVESPHGKAPIVPVSRSCWLERVRIAARAATIPARPPSTNNPVPIALP